MAAIRPQEVNRETAGTTVSRPPTKHLTPSRPEARPLHGGSFLSGLQTIHWLSLLLFFLAITVSAIGLFDHGPGPVRSFVNAYGDTVNLYGKGLYRNDSVFRAPIFRGTDFTILFVAAPLLLVAIILDLKKATVATRMLMASAIGVILYYAANVAFGVTYNKLHLVYTLLFSASFFSLLLALMRLEKTGLVKSIRKPLPRKGITTFLVLTGLALYLAWLPDIIAAFRAGRPLLLIEHYTTEVTYVLDMGIIAPLCFLCLYLLRSGNGWGYVLLDLLLTLCLVVGVMLPVQTTFQVVAGVDVPLPALVTKMGTFCVLAVFAFYFKTRLIKSLAA